MASIPLVNQSERSSGMGGDLRFVGSAARENRPSDAGELVGEGDRQHIAVQAPGCLLDPGPQAASGGRRSPRKDDVGGLHEQRPQVLVAALGDLTQDRAIPRRLLLGTSPSQAPKSRPCLNPLPLPIAATTALEMIGPTPGTVINRWQLSSCCASASISAETLSMRSSSRRQSWARSAIRRTILGESTSAFELRISGSALRKGITPWRTVMPRSIRNPRIWLIRPVRWPTRRERTRCNASRSICSGVLIATKRIVGRCTASAIARRRGSRSCAP